LIEIKSVPVSEITPRGTNPRTHSPDQIEQIAASIQEFSFTNPVLVDSDGVLIAGHGRLEAAKSIGMTHIPAITLDHLTPAQAKALVLADNQLALNAGWDEDLLSKELAELKDEDFNLEVIGFDEDELDRLLTVEMDDEPTGDPNEVPEPPTDPFCKSGDIVILGDHRLMCGDSTNQEDVALLMRDEKAVLCHADPPYGMGKGKDGVENDNLYREKLDKFQMDWWGAFRPFLADNASAYIWGNAVGLWRLWYQGGLAGSERLIFRNHIAWDKGGGGFGVGSKGLRCYFPSEHCLFFMLGEQGFNNNADNYWDGWEPIRLYLDGERKKMGWDTPTCKKIAGHKDLHKDHWFSKSQWEFLTEKVYLAFQEAAKNTAFKREHDELKREHDELKREHDELKREFYGTRAFFDNTHENMTDVWQFSRVQGEERHGHATPKPVDMVARVFKSSCPVGGIIVVPFSGSGSDIIAGEMTKRKVFAMEISPKYCDVAIRRWEKYTGKIALYEDGREFPRDTMGDSVG